jgi:alanine-synthesizing transaminase
MSIANPYYLDESNGWQPDIEDIKSKVNDKTRAIIILNPHNPTGSIISAETLRQIIDIAKKHNLVILADEIYDKLIMDGMKLTSCASLDHEVPIVTFGGLSKNYMVPGFRIGWGIVSGDKTVLKDYVEAINKMLRARLSANHPEQYGIAPALLGDQSHLEIARQKLTKRRNLTVEMMNSINGISCVPPLGAFYAFPRLHKVTDDAKFVIELLKETGVVVVHGGGFGQMPGTSHFRIVFLPPENILEKAYNAISKFHEKYINEFEKVVS